MPYPPHKTQGSTAYVNFKANIIAIWSFAAYINKCVQTSDLSITQNIQLQICIVVPIDMDTLADLSIIVSLLTSSACSN